MEIYCAHCRRKTPTKNLQHENLITHSKTGKSTPREIVKGLCTVCSTSKQQFVAANTILSKPKSYKSKKAKMYR